jgi:hypothetical protein
MGIKHAFTSAKSDGDDNTLVQPGDWNADHLNGAVMTVSTSAPSTPSDGDLWWDTDDATVVSGGYDPWIIDVFVFDATGNTNWSTMNRSIGAEVYGNDIYSSGAQNDARWWNVYIPAGTWTFILHHVKAANQGIYDVQIDGSSIGTIAGYAGTTSYDNVSTITGVSVATTSLKTLKLLMATKNASASNYYGEINHIALHRTA